MKNGPECIPCCLRRVLATASLVTTDEWLRRKVLAEAMQDLARADELAPPAEIVHQAMRRAGKTLGDADPWAAEKQRANASSRAILAAARERVAAAPDPFRRALELALAADLFDWEFRDEVEPGFSLKALLSDRFTLPRSTPGFVETVEDLRAAVARAASILYVHASAAELLFDRLLIEQFRRPPAAVACVVRESAVLAQATRADAAEIGLGEVAAAVIDPGVACLGLPLSICSQTFRDAYDAADVIIAKGQATYETLDAETGSAPGRKKDVFYLLRARCPLVARTFGVEVGDVVLELG
jgi:uncharacterized protein with ATP-grasp and redox domains